MTGLLVSAGTLQEAVYAVLGVCIAWTVGGIVSQERARHRARRGGHPASHHWNDPIPKRPPFDWERDL